MTILTVIWDSFASGEKKKKKDQDVKMDEQVKRNCLLLSSCPVPDPVSHESAFFAHCLHKSGLTKPLSKASDTATVHPERKAELGSRCYLCLLCE